MNIERIKQAEQLLNEWLVDNTEKVFEEQPEIDEVRGLLIEYINKKAHEMKTYVVSIRYESFVDYHIEAGDEIEALDKAWLRFEKCPPTTDDGSWQHFSTEQLIKESGML